MSVMFVLGLFVGCEGGSAEVVMSGVVLDAPGGAGSTVEGALVSIFDQTHVAGEVAETDAAGAFSVIVPAGEVFFVHAAAEGFVSTGFQGAAGTSSFSLASGYPWIATPEYLAGAVAAWVGCPDLDRPGTLIMGEARFSQANVDPAYSPPAPGVTVVVQDSAGETHTACYIDETGVVDPALTETAITGAFAVFGVPEGAFLLTLSQSLSSGDVSESFEFDAPADGLVPVYPVMVTEFE